MRRVVLWLAVVSILLVPTVSWGREGDATGDGQAVGQALGEVAASEGDATEGAASEGAASEGAASEGATGEGATSEGAASEGAAAEGAADSVDSATDPSGASGESSATDTVDSDGKTEDGDTQANPASAPANGKEGDAADATSKEEHRQIKGPISVGVVEFSNEHPYWLPGSIFFYDDAPWKSNPGRPLSYLISREFAKDTERYTVVDQDKLIDLLAEHQITAVGFPDPDTCAQIADVCSVDFLLVGNITEFYFKSPKSSFFGNILNALNPFDKATANVKLVCQLKLIDAHTGCTVKAWDVTRVLDVESTGTGIGLYSVAVTFGSRNVTGDNTNKQLEECAARMKGLVDESWPMEYPSKPEPVTARVTAISEMTAQQALDRIAVVEKQVGEIEKTLWDAECYGVDVDRIYELSARRISAAIAVAELIRASSAAQAKWLDCERAEYTSSLENAQERIARLEKEIERLKTRLAKGGGAAKNVKAPKKPTATKKKPAVAKKQVAAKKPAVVQKPVASKTDSKPNSPTSTGQQEDVQNSDSPNGASAASTGDEETAGATGEEASATSTGDGATVESTGDGKTAGSTGDGATAGGDGGDAATAVNPLDIRPDLLTIYDMEPAALQEHFASVHQAWDESITSAVKGNKNPKEARCLILTVKYTQINNELPYLGYLLPNTWYVVELPSADVELSSRFFWVVRDVAVGGADSTTFTQRHVAKLEVVSRAGARCLCQLVGERKVIKVDDKVVSM